MSLQKKLTQMYLPLEIQAEFTKYINLTINVPMTISVFGETSIGKSTYNNAMCGHEIHEVGNLETTQCIVRFQDSDDIQVEYQNCTKSFKELATAQKYMQNLMRDMKENDDNKNITLHCPIPSLRCNTKIRTFLSNKTVFLDTMGIRHENHTEAFQYLNSISSNSVSVWLTGYSTLYDETKLHALAKQISKTYAHFGSQTPLILLVNKVDQHNESDGSLQTTLRYVQKILTKESLSSKILPFSSLLASLASRLEVAYLNKDKTSILNCLSKIKNLGMNQIKPILIHRSQIYNEDQEYEDRKLLETYFEQRKSDILLQEKIESVLDLLYRASGLQDYLHELKKTYSHFKEKMHLAPLYDFCIQKRKEIYLNSCILKEKVPAEWNDMFDLISYLEKKYDFQESSPVSVMDYTIGDMWNGFVLLDIKKEGQKYKLFRCADPNTPNIHSEILISSTPSSPEIQRVRDTLEILNIPYTISSEYKSIQYCRTTY